MWLLSQAVLLLSKEIWGWLMEAHHSREELKYAIAIDGALYVMTTGGILMLMLLVDN